MRMLESCEIPISFFCNCRADALFMVARLCAHRLRQWRFAIRPVNVRKCRRRALRILPLFRDMDLILVYINTYDIVWLRLGILLRRETVALSDGVERSSFVLSNYLSLTNNGSDRYRNESPEEFTHGDIAHKAETLAVCLLCYRQIIFLRKGANF